MKNCLHVNNTHLFEVIHDISQQHRKNCFLQQLFVTWNISPTIGSIGCTLISATLKSRKTLHIAINVCAFSL